MRRGRGEETGERKSPGWGALETLRQAATAFQASLGRSWPQGAGSFAWPQGEPPGHREFARALTRYAVSLGDEGMGLLAEPIVLGTFHLAADAVVGEPTLFDIWRKCARFSNTVTAAPPLSARILDGRAALVWQTADPARAHPIFPFVQLLFFQRLTVWLTGQKAIDGILHVNAGAAPFVDDWAGILRGRVERSDFVGFSVPGELAALPNIQDHKALAELASRPAEYMLFVDDEPGLTERVRRVLVTRPGEIVSLDTVSNILHVSARSLTRHLAAEGTTFSDLRTDVICEVASRLLGRTSLPVAEIARHLGFAEAASFNRLFRRGMGMAPSAYRRALALTRIDDIS